MTTGIIIQARLGSSRLPGKILLPMPSGLIVIESVLDACLNVEAADEIVVAVPRSDAEIISGAVSQCHPELFDDDYVDRDVIGLPSVSMHQFDGEENDVLGRYLTAAEARDLSIIVRVTADCPRIDPETIDQVIALREAHGADYASNVYPVREWPTGWDVEVFTRELLVAANVHATDAYDREHVTPWMQQDPYAKRALLKSMTDRSHERYVLDTLDDYRHLWSLRW